MIYKCVVAFMLMCLMQAVNAAQCSLNTQSLFFGEYDYTVPLPVNATGLIWIQCDVNTPVRVALDAGLYSGGNPLARQMESGAGGAALRYNVYADSSYTQVWGDGSRGTSISTVGATSSATNAVVYGRLPPFQNVPAGTYQDSLLITVEW